MVKFVGLEFDNHISIGHIITTCAAIVTGSILFANMQNDIANLKANDARLEKTQIEYRIYFDRTITEYRGDYKADINMIMDKLDKIYEKLDKKADRK